ncbi:hypothetical protein CRU96_13090 [Malaciobacter halophilus]|nr:hypothetical protein [Malaciobacter halophilus]RYA22432.1 hypothetical protein CRU96_13090 [Malaciobacter halophilus]
MIGISFEINGKKVNPNNIGDALENAMLQQIGESIKKSIGSLRCSEHNQTPKVLVKGKSLDKLSIEVSGCCDDIVKKATDKLN